MLVSLNQLLGVKGVLSRFHKAWLLATQGVKVPRDTRLSLSSRFRAVRGGGIEIGSETLIAFKTLILNRHPLTGEVRPVRIGSRCFVGGGATLMPGVVLGDECLVAAGSVVFESMPGNTIVGGNPARVLRSGVTLKDYGRLPISDFSKWPD